MSKSASRPGFTLVELLVVVAITGILVALLRLNYVADGEPLELP